MPEHVAAEVPLRARSLERYAQVVGREQYAKLERALERARRLLGGRTLWHVNSTARGGGVAEMLQSIVPYFRGASVDSRWAVIEGDPEFFAVTKRIHNNLHGELGDAGELGEQERQTYERVLDANAEGLTSMMRAGDIAILHDPQTAGLSRRLRAAGVPVMWRCHVGLDTPNPLARRAWDFLRPFVVDAGLYLFSRRAFSWEGLAEDRIRVVPPAIDAFSPKNQEFEPEVVDAILATAGILDVAAPTEPEFQRDDQTRGRVKHPARFFDEGSPIPPVSLVTQVSRWDRLKDPFGVVEGFARYIASRCDSHLIVAGPAVEDVTDDPEGAGVLEEVRELRQGLPEEVRARVHLVELPMEDREENAAIVNALQRRSHVIVQKSIAEGFGLTVSEAMWKRRSLVASGIGGIQDQVIDGESGILIRNPTDLLEFGDATVRLLGDGGLATRLADGGRERVREHFLEVRHLIQHVHLIEELAPF